MVDIAVYYRILKSIFADLSAYYASLEAAPATTDSVMTASAPVKAETPALDGDEDDDMEDVSMGPRNAAGSSTATAVPANTSATDKGEEDDFEETAVPTASTTSVDRDIAEGEVDPNTIVMGPYSSRLAANQVLTLVSTVNGEPMPFSQVQDNEDLLDQMTPDEYSVRRLTFPRFAADGGEMLSGLLPSVGCLSRKLNQTPEFEGHFVPALRSVRERFRTRPLT